MCRKKVWLKGIAAIVGIMLSACGPVAGERTIELDEIVSDAEAEAVESRAIQGDVLSMIRLSRFVGMRRNDVMEARHWLWLAAKHGSCAAIVETISYCEEFEEREHCGKWYRARERFCPTVKPAS